MTHSPVARNSKDGSSARNGDLLLAIWRQLVAATADSGLMTISALCAIALLITINLILRFPDFGAVIEQYNQF